MNSKWFELTALALMDDGILSISDHAWRDFINTSLKEQKLSKATTPTHSALSSRSQQDILTKKKPQTKVFSSRPSLREMMSEYNKPAPKNRASIHTHNAFRLERIQRFSIPTIPGKILRPRTNANS